MICQNISKDWLLKAPGSDEFVPVDLPNDYSITQPRTPQGTMANGYFPEGVGAYRKYLYVPDDRKHYILDVDGAYMCALVTFNEQTLLMHPHGYTPFLVDLTDHLRRGGTNKLQIQTNALRSSSRWYSGAGLYRDVFLWTGGDPETGARIEPRDVFVTTPTLEDINVAVDVSADKEVRARLTVEILDHEGRLLASQFKDADLNGSTKTGLILRFTLEDTRPWSLEDPYLYTIRTRLEVEGRPADEDTRTFGIRTVSADVRNGFRLNGRTVKMRGGCIHHDHGALGAADYPAACLRKLTLLKEAGFNALRIAHNPPSRLLLELCDRMGILVMDEAFDTWLAFKGGNGNYHLWFADWWQRDIASMVLRDRAYPCVISYSIGNEIPESRGFADTGIWAARLAAEIRRLDDTRFVTSGTCCIGAQPDPLDPEDYRKDFCDRYLSGKTAPEPEDRVEEWIKRAAPYHEQLDICGYNYLFRHYEHHHELFPDRVFWGSETHTIYFYDSWQKVLELPYVIGDFTWTAYDNLGEAGAGRFGWAGEGVVVKGIGHSDYPWRSCFQGDLDLCGYLRPQAYYRRAIWLGDGDLKIFTIHPKHNGDSFSGTTWHFYDVHETWTFEDAYLGEPVECHVYTTADAVKWYLNGRCLGESVPEKGIARMNIPYARGTVSVQEISGGIVRREAFLTTTGEPALLSVTPETNTLRADGRDLAYIDVFVTDHEGRRVTESLAELTCTVEGGELLAVFSGDPCNEDQYGSPICHAFDGRAVAVIRTRQPGTVKITVTSPGLAEASCEVRGE